MNKRVAILSYGTGNLASLKDALNFLGASCVIATSAQDLIASEAIVLPGVGSFSHATNFLRETGLLQPTLARIKSGAPTLGICLGFQLLTRYSEEGDLEGLGLFRCDTRRIRPSSSKIFKVPHLGWNNISATRGTPILLSSVPREDQVFYFSNAYSVGLSPELPSPIGIYQHGGEFVAMLEQGSLFGVQFHPEKSRTQGMQVLRNFLRF